MFIPQAETKVWLDIFNLQMTNVDQNITNQLGLHFKTLLPMILISVPMGQSWFQAFLNNFHLGPLQKLRSALLVTISINKRNPCVFQNC